MILIIILFLALGFIGLYFGAKLVVISLENIAHRWGVSHLMVGLTILAIGTSLPEIAISVMGGIEKLSVSNPNIDGIVIGNKIGSFLTQITLIIGILGLSQQIFVSKWELRREGTMMFISIGIFILFAIDLVITRFEAFLMMLAYVLYIVFIIWSEKRIAKDIEYACSENETLDPHCFEVVDESAIKTKSIKVDFGIFLAGLVVLLVAAELTLIAAEGLSELLNLPANVIGILIVGLGTSIPELVADLTALRRESYGIAVGDILGSNICDILFATGAGAIISEFNVPLIILIFDIPMLIIAVCIALYFLWTEKTLKRWEAAVLVSFYGMYVILKILYFQSSAFYFVA